MSKGGTAVVLQRAKHGIGVADVAGGIEQTARSARAVSGCGIAAQVVSMRCHCAREIVDIFARSAGVQNRVLEVERHAPRKPTVVVDAAAVGGRVAAKGAVV